MTTQPAKREVDTDANPKGEWLGSRGCLRLKWLKMGAECQQRRRQASVRHTHCDRNGLDPGPDNSPLCQIVADRAIRPVVATPGGSGRYGKLMMEGKLITFAAPQLTGMVYAQDVAQLAPKQRRCA